MRALILEADPDMVEEWKWEGHSGLVAPRDCLHRGGVHEGCEAHVHPGGQRPRPIAPPQFQLGRQHAKGDRHPRRGEGRRGRVPGDREGRGGPKSKWPAGEKGQARCERGQADQGVRRREGRTTSRARSVAAWRLPAERAQFQKIHRAPEASASDGNEKKRVKEQKGKGLLELLPKHPHQRTTNDRQHCCTWLRDGCHAEADTAVFDRRRVGGAPDRGQQVVRAVVPRTTPIAPKRAADQSFIPLPNIAALIERSGGARRGSVRPRVGQVVLTAAVTS